MKEEKLEYNKAFIDTVDSLSAVNHRILIDKIGDKVQIRANNLESNFCYVLEAPLSYLNMPTDHIGIIDFARFKRFYEALSSKTTPASLSVTVDDENDAVDMIFKNENRSDKLTLRLGDCSLPTFKPSFNELAEHEKNVVAVFDEETINELQKKISIIGGDYIDVMANEKVLNFCIYTMRSADRADHPVFLEQDASGQFQLKFAAGIVSMLPKGQYNLEIDAGGCLYLKQIREDEISLEIMLLAEE